MNWYIIILIGVASIVLIIFLIRRNWKDKENLEEKLNQDYPKLSETDVNDSNVV